MIKFLLGYNDDNHNTMFWFDREYIGDQTEDVAEQMFSYGMEEGLYSNTELESLIITLDLLANAGLNDNEIDIIHNYLCYPKVIDKNVWNALTKQDFKTAIIFIKNL